MADDRRSWDPFAPHPAAATEEPGVADGSGEGDPDPRIAADDHTRFKLDELAALAERYAVSADGTKAEILARIRAALGY